MRCYNCGCRLSEQDFCTNCGADVTLYKKIMRVSNMYYNEGLEKAGVRDLTGAVTSRGRSGTEIFVFRGSEGQGLHGNGERAYGKPPVYGDIRGTDTEWQSPFRTEHSRNL